MTDRLIRGAVALWFLMLASTVAYGIASTLVNDVPLTGLDIARLTSKACLLSFLAMMGYLTIVRENPVTRAAGWQPRISAFVGTNLVFIGVLFLRQRDDLSISEHFISAGLILAGNGICIYVLSHLGTSFSLMAEARKLVTKGPYSIVRHPLYLAEQIAIIGIFIQFSSIAAVILVAVHFAFQLKRMLNEEILLRETFSDYAFYMTRTARLIPMIW